MAKNTPVKLYLIHKAANLQEGTADHDSVLSVKYPLPSTLCSNLTAWMWVYKVVQTPVEGVVN